MKEGTVPVPPTAHSLRARETYYLFVELSHVGKSELAEVKNPCTFNFFSIAPEPMKRRCASSFPNHPAGEDDHLKYYEYIS